MVNVLNREQRLKNLLDAEERVHSADMERLLHRRNAVRVGVVLYSLAGFARTRAIYAYFIDRDLDRCKQNFYLASKLVHASVGEDGGASFEMERDIQIALLSDSAEIIKAIAYVETPHLVSERSNPLYNRFNVYMLQMAIRGEDEVVNAMIKKIAEHGRKPLRAECAGGRDFFSLLLKGDKAGLENLIEKHASNKGSGNVAEEFMAYRATLEAKLCWYRGIPVEIDHPLVPMDMMPIRPLAHYDNVYEFLEPGWVPPPQGFRGKLSRLFSKGS